MSERTFNMAYNLAKEKWGFTEEQAIDYAIIMPLREAINSDGTPINSDGTPMTREQVIMEVYKGCYE